MKRLKKYFREMQRTDCTYREIYEGPYYDFELDEMVYEPIYCKNNIHYSVLRTHKLKLDLPTVIVKIPIEEFYIEKNYLSEENFIPIADYCLRTFNGYISNLNKELFNRTRPADETGLYYSYIPGGEVVLRNACYILKQDSENLFLTIQLLIQFPKANHKKACRMICNDLPNAIEQFIIDFDTNELIQRIELYRQQEAIRKWLKNSKYCAFIGNGSILPRDKTNDNKLPNAQPFLSSMQDEIEICGIRGMGIRKGVTVITGGGYSGKSTILDAISSGVYNHVKNDGREYVISDDTAMTISAEDGRAVKNVDISLFIKWLPSGSPKSFSTDKASGSTSQAANIVEAMSYGAKLLLIDEDKSATNFMIQDEIMKKLICEDPITPFAERVIHLYDQYSISTVLVIGGSSEYLSKASNVIIMKNFNPVNITEQIRQIKKLESNISKPNELIELKRFLLNRRFTSYPENSTTEKLEVSEFGFIVLGDEKVDYKMIHDITSEAQVTAIAFIIRKLQKDFSGTSRQFDYINELKKIVTNIKNNGFDDVYSSFFTTKTWLELPRINEICAVINRMRYIEFCINRK